MPTGNWCGIGHTELVVALSRGRVFSQRTNMNSRKWLLVLVAGALGCSSATGHLPIEGELKIDVPVPAADADAGSPEVFVYLGDGTKHLERLGADGTVVFSDPSLKGPQDITVAWAYGQGGSGSKGFHTALEVDRREVHLEPAIAPASSDETAEPYGVLTVKVSGLSDDPEAEVRVSALAGDRRIGTGRAAAEGLPFPNGTAEVEVALEEEPQGPISVVAYETGAELEELRKIGMVRKVTLDAFHDARLELQVAQAKTEVVTVDVGVGTRGTARASVGVTTKAASGFLGTGKLGTPPLEVSTLVLEGEWEEFTRTTCLQRFSSDGWSGGASPLASANAARIDLLDIPTLVVPPAAAEGEPAQVAPTEPLAFEWRADSRATGVRIRVASMSTATWQWTVEAPASRTSFSPPPVPAAIAWGGTIPNGIYEATLSSTRSESISSYSNLFVPRTPDEPSCDLIDGKSRAHAFTRGLFERK
jgi:hypothetical protein